MFDRQLASNSGYDYGTNASESSSYLDLDDTWRESTQPIFTTFTPYSEETVTTDDLRTFEKPWADSQFEPTVISRQKWWRKRTATGATSPYLLFLSGPGPAPAFDTLLAFIRYGLAREDGERLAERLAELKLDLAEDKDLPDLSIPSVLGLIHFLGENPQLRDPSLVVSNMGYIRAEWHESWTQHFVVEFTSDTDARFVLFIADSTALQKKVRVSVICSIASLMDHALPHGVSAWAMRT